MNQGHLKNICECRCEFDGWRSGLDKSTSQ